MEATTEAREGEGSLSFSPPPTNPHDRFFNYAFGQAQHAAGLLRASLPEALAERLDWGSLERRPTNFIDARLRRLYGDLLFSARTTDSHEDTFLYALTEHQSRPHALMAYRVLRYMVGVWDEHLRVSPGIATIPFIASVVVYHGRDAWTPAQNLRGLFDAPTHVLAAAGENVPDLRYRFIDLRHDAEDRSFDPRLTDLGRAAFWAFQHAGDDEDLIAAMRARVPMLRAMCEGPGGRDALRAFLEYLLASHRHLEPSEIFTVLTEATDPETADEALSMADRLRLEGGAGLLLDQMTDRFGPIPDDMRARLKRASPAELRAWARRVVRAATLEEVFA